MFKSNLKKYKLFFLLLWLCLFLFSYKLGSSVEPTYLIKQEKETSFEDPSISFVTPDESIFLNTRDPYILKYNEKKIEYVIDNTNVHSPIIKKVSIIKHYSIWSFLPALVTLMLCWITREPVISLLTGILSGALLLKNYNLIEDVFLETLMQKNSATIILLYFFFLGGMLGLWAKTGADKAFAEWVTKYFVKGPVSAKVITWLLGVLFFQGGTVSVVLVGTTVKPIADKEKISHAELAYIVDSTAAPIASQLAFNAWPGYIQSFLFVSGVTFLATETARIAFFFQSVPFCFYAIFAVLGTFLLAIDKPLYIGKKMKASIKRAREGGQLSSPAAFPLTEQETAIPKNYKANIFEFFIPLLLIISISVSTFIINRTPNILMAFSLAVTFSMVTAFIKGMQLKDIINGLVSGLKQSSLGLLILLLAFTIGNITIQTGAGVFIVNLIGNSVPYWIMPLLLYLISVVIAFSTGTSWGTYAIAFPIAMPLAWAVAQYSGLGNPELFMTICFACVMDGAVYGDQCSPISDTTVLSAMCTGCGLMEHVKTQIPQATLAAGLAMICWSICMLFV